MKTRSEVTAEKLRGGFYTPPPLIEICLSRIREQLPDQNLRILEPSVGDGAFLRALGSSDLRSRISGVLAVEPLEIEAEKARRALRAADIQGAVLAQSVLPWANSSNEAFDAAVGNPPFVRYQFISPDDRAAVLELGRRMGVEFAGVSNLWIPVLLAALGRLRPGGVFSFVIPTECLTGCSAAVVRRWLLDECDAICLDLFAPGSFPGVLQEVMVLSGRRATSRPALIVRIVEHISSCAREWAHTATEAARPWTRYLLDPIHVDALDSAASLAAAKPLGEIAAFEVSIVTGANDFFSVDDPTLQEHDLERWARPLLARTRHAPGLILTNSDREQARASGEKVWLLDFAADQDNPTKVARAARYVRMGEDLGLHRRYKCRIREPWYRVPGFVRGELLLSKRSHLWPRAVVNEIGVYTTDTIYRGRLLTKKRTARDVAAAFHNSLTLLTAEVEGRSFGGGVLELVPSEIARLTTLIPRGAERRLAEFDGLSRTGPPEALIEATDDYLVSTRAIPAELIPLLREARGLLASRRFGRNRRIDTEVPAPRAAA